MISYVILTDNQMAETKDKDEAARTCLRVGVPILRSRFFRPYDAETGLER